MAPYIHPSNRRDIDVFGANPVTAGELNYVITNVILKYLKAAPPVGYTRYNEVMGVLECVKQELYRRAVVPYESAKAEEHGDLEWPSV